MLHDTLRTDMQAAMKAKDAVRLQTLRLALTACTNTLVEKGKKPTEKLTDEETAAVLKRLVKQRQESATQYRNASQEERAAAEDSEKGILESYLPPTMPEDEVRTIVIKTRDELGVSEKKDIGALMKAVMQKLKGQADGSVVSRIANECLN